MPNDIEILVATHKDVDDKLRFDSCYKFIQVGAADKPAFEGMIQDDTKENISNKNATYCELTALFWSWKNSNAKYKGVCHYRRYLAKHYFGTNEHNEVFTKKELSDILKENDLILPEPKYKNFKNKNTHLYSSLEELEKDESYAMVKKALLNIHPEDLKELNDVYMDDKLSFCNVIIGRADAFDKYCEWLFPLTKEIERLYNLEKGVPDREIGFVSEWLLNVWILKYKEEYKVCYAPLMRVDRRHGLKYIICFIVERMQLLKIMDRLFHKWFL